MKKGSVPYDLETNLIDLLNKVLPEPVEAKTLLNDIELHQLGLNSIGMVKLISEIESFFHIEADDDFLIFENFNTYSKIRDSILRLLS
jgi:acyl carrier protein